MRRSAACRLPPNTPQQARRGPGVSERCVWNSMKKFLLPLIVLILFVASAFAQQTAPNAATDSNAQGNNAPQTSEAPAPAQGASPQDAAPQAAAPQAVTQEPAPAQ